jgi:hypothetical protein
VLCGMISCRQMPSASGKQSVALDTVDASSPGRIEGRSRLDHMQKFGVDPIVLHMTWTYGGQEGKRYRFRQLGLWSPDPDSYYTQHGFVTVDAPLPEVLTDRQTD